MKNLRRNGEISIVFFSDREIRTINRRFMGENRPTDVIAFPYARSSLISGKDSAPFADIALSLDTARRQAREGKHAEVQECALLILHGLLHLAGYEDGTRAKREKMFAMQKKVFRAVRPELAPPDFA
ncbi:MAG: rRNA maturation RNase YbeY [Elusimicrobia bacterium]|nr:rRNA maturation RNase YbeY [Elusimicrobiota bacterium]